LGDPVAQAKPVGQQTGIRPGAVLAMAGAGCLLILICVWLATIGQIHREKVRLRDQLTTWDNADAAELAIAQADEEKKIADERAQQAQLLNDPEFRSGELANKRHAAEWAKRIAHDPSFAISSLDKTLLKMEQLGRDPAVAAQAALQEVALMALPPGSRVEVVPAGDKFVVRTAFKMSAMSTHEKGAVTKHTSTASMRREIENLSARLAQQLFDYCGSRGIERVTISCNHTVKSSMVPLGATPRERKYILRAATPVMSSLYRMRVDASSLAAAGKWRSLSIPQMLHLMSVERDGLQTLAIDNFLNAEAEDPNMPPEF
jgi:hypothetical protein